MLNLEKEIPADSGGGGKLQKAQSPSGRKRHFSLNSYGSGVYKCLEAQRRERGVG